MDEMEILKAVFGSHGDNLQKAMSRATHRQSLLTQNISNVNTPGYKRQDADLNIVLTDDRSTSSRMSSMLAQREQRQSEDGSLRLDGNSVDMEREAYAVAETELRYQLLTDLTNRYFSNLKTAIREGK